jgi:DNA modification methylase
MYFRDALQIAGFKFAQCCIWVKQAFVIGRQDYQWQHEPVLYGWKPTAPHQWYADRCQTTVWNFDRPIKNDLHPTMKPIGLVAYPVQNSSKPNQIILDPFGGSGSTLIVCEQMHRICRMVEIDPTYCDVIKIRWESFTGRKAALVSQ